MKKFVIAICFSILGTLNPLELLSEEKYTPYKSSDKMDIRDLNELYRNEVLNKPLEDILNDPYQQKYTRELLEYTEYLKNLKIPKGEENNPKYRIKLFPDIPTKAANKLLICFDKINFKDPQKVIDAANESLDIAWNWFAYSCRGLGKQALEDYVGAIKDYELALKLMPKYYLDWAGYTFSNLSAAKIGIKQYKDAIADANAAISLNVLIKSPQPQPFFNRGLSIIKLEGESNSKYKKSRYRQSIADFSKAIELNPNYLEAYESRFMANYLLDQNNKESYCPDVLKAKELGSTFNVLDEVCEEY